MGSAAKGVLCPHVRGTETHQAHCSAACSQRSLAAAALSCTFVGAVVLCPKEFTSSFGFWNSGVAKNGDGVRADGILGSSSSRRKDSGLGGSANRTLRAGVLGTLLGAAMVGVFLFRALDRLKVVVGSPVISSSSEWLECSSPAALSRRASGSVR